MHNPCVLLLRTSQPMWQISSRNHLSLKAPTSKDRTRRAPSFPPSASVAISSLLRGSLRTGSLLSESRLSGNGSSCLSGGLLRLLGLGLLDASLLHCSLCGSVDGHCGGLLEILGMMIDSCSRKDKFRN
jgi:hypothetical protein